MAMKPGEQVKLRNDLSQDELIWPMMTGLKRNTSYTVKENYGLSFTIEGFRGTFLCRRFVPVDNAIHKELDRVTSQLINFQIPPEIQNSLNDLKKIQWRSEEMAPKFVNREDAEQFYDDYEFPEVNSPLITLSRNQLISLMVDFAKSKL